MSDSQDKNMPIKWNAERTMFVISEIETKGELLYNNCHEHHTNKIKRIQVQEEICQNFKRKFKIDLTVKLLMEKWSALKGQFRNELKKVKDSHNSMCSANDIYIPRVYWFDALAFLIPYTEIDVSQSTNNVTNNINEPTTVILEQDTPQPVKKKKRYEDDFLEKSSAALQILTEKMSIPEPQSEFATFGNYITSELEAMAMVSRAAARSAKFKISRIIVDAAEELENKYEFERLSN